MISFNFLKKYIPEVFFFSIIVIALLLSSRALIIGGLSSLIFMLYMRYPQVVNKRILLWVVITMILAVITLAFLYKTDSTLSRILIYKISFSILKDAYLFGIGLGNFKHTYLDYQAFYFANGNFTEKEMLLAGNTYYAFNDYYQFIIEAGLIGLFVLIFLFISIYKLIKKCLLNTSFIVKISIGILIAITIAALFTHVFEKLLTQVLFVSSIAFLLLSIATKKSKSFILIIGLVINLVLIFKEYGFYLLHLDDYKKFRAAEELYDLGYYNTAKENFESLYPVLKHDAEFLSLLADLNFRLNNPKECLQLYHELIKVKKHHLNYMKLAKAYEQINKHKAVYYYKKAINCVPNRFTTRYALFNFYVKKMCYKDAIGIGNEILTIPIKVPSKRVFSIKRDVKLILLNLK